MKILLSHKRNSQSGFIAAQLVSAVAASFAVMALAASYINVWSNLIDQQKIIQAQNQANQIANIIASSAEFGDGYAYAAPAISDQSGGESSIAHNYIASDSDVIRGGRLPTGFSFASKYQDAEYFPFLYMPESGNATPPGYYIAQRGGLPKNDDVSFAILLRAPGSNHDYTIAEIKQGLAHGEDILITRRMDQVGANSWRTFIANAGNIPTCGALTMPDGSRKYTMLKWKKDADQKTWRWVCETTDLVKDYLVADPENPNTNLFCNSSNNEALSTQFVTDAQGQIQYLTDGNGNRVKDNMGNDIPKKKLVCTQTIAPQVSTPYGQYIDDQGNAHDLVNDRMGMTVQCSGNASVIRYTASGQLICTDTGTTLNLSLSCPVGKYISRSYTNYHTCFPYSWASIVANPGPGARQSCNNGRTPYYSDQRTFCPEDSAAGGLRLCADGFDAMNVSTNGGLGCYLSTNPNAPLDRSAITAAQYSPNYPLRTAGCPANNILAIQSNERGLVACNSLFEFIKPYLPSAPCPNQSATNVGALTWDGSRFTCTTVD